MSATPNRMYRALVPPLMNGEVRETVIVDTGVEPVVVDGPQEIEVERWKKDAQ